MRVIDFPRWPAFVDAGSPDRLITDDGIGYLDTIFEDLTASAVLIVDTECEELRLFWAKRCAGFDSGDNIAEKLYLKPFTSSLTIFKELLSIEMVSTQLAQRVGSPQILPLDEEYDTVVFDKYLIIVLRDQIGTKLTSNWLEVRPIIVRAVSYIESRMNFFGLIPTQMYSVKSNDSKVLFRNYFGPVYPQFQKEGWFVWPWQVSEDQLRKSPVQTASLVMDIRSSTAAMSQSRSQIEFMKWVDELVMICRSSVIEFGGVYDKEIGDGVVGHFTDAISRSCFSSEENPKRDFCLAALLAAEDISRKVKERTIEFQDYLAMGIDNVGPAVGVHIGNAVWISKDIRVSAVGDSVIWATRMSNNADANQVVISNAVRTYLETCNIDSANSRLSQMEKIPIEVKELPESLKPFGYSFWVK